MPEISEDLDIIVTGFEVDQVRAEAGLMRVFGLDAQRARNFVEQLPVIAKRCNELEAAERYAQALRSIGARIELRPHTASGAARPSGRSLPPPDPTQLEPASRSLEAAQAPDSLRSSASQRAIARIRAAEGVAARPSSRPASTLDLYNPVIPKAPALPRDMHPIPNPRRATKSERPEWMISDMLDLTPERDGDTPTSLRPSDSESLRVTTPRPPSKSSGPPGERLSERPRSVGLAHAATASGRPGLSAVSHSTPPAASLRRRVLKLTAVLAGLLALAAFVLRLGGQLLSADERRVRAWRQEGIEAGEHAVARTWLSGAGHSLRGLDGAAADRLLDQLERAGATSVFAVRITGTPDHQQATAVLVEMPVDRVARRTILWHLASARAERDGALSDEGQRFELLELQ